MRALAAYDETLNTEHFVQYSDHFVQNPGPGHHPPRPGPLRV